MQRICLTICLILAASGFAPAQAPNASGMRSEATAVSMFDFDALDRTVDPCTDFYQYACGGWLKKNPVPSDHARWGRFSELAENNRVILRALLEKAGTAAAQRTANDRMIGDFYASCMDEEEIEKKGIAPLRPQLDRIAQLKTKADLPAYLAYLHGAGRKAFFVIEAAPDFKNPGTLIAAVGQGGASLPDRASYFREDPKSREVREKFVQHVRNMFQLLGWKPEKAKSGAETVMNIETALADVSLDSTALHDPHSLYHRMPLRELQALSPAFEWSSYFAGIPSPEVSEVNVVEPGFFKGMVNVIAAMSMEDIRAYLTWNVLRDAAPMLPRAFVNERFRFFGRTLTGQEELRPRWKRCVAATDEALGEALGAAYVERTFGPEGKQRTLAMVRALEAALGRDVAGVPWMTEETKRQALLKLHAVDNRIGSPDTGRDYGALMIVRGDALGNMMRAGEFESRRRLGKIGGPLDRSEWKLSPATVNAAYNPQENSITFPAGILQPPFFDRKADDGLNFSGIGSVIGHELTHGFDDKGRRFDAEGNLRDWWTGQDAKAFDAHAGCFVDEYDEFSVVDDVHIDGMLTLSENIADNGGLIIALMAYLAGAGSDAPTIDGFSPEQRFFLHWGQIWCENATPEALRLQAQSSEHSTARFRVNGVVRNMPEFEKAFQCTPGAALVPARRCRVW